MRILFTVVMTLSFSTAFSKANSSLAEAYIEKLSNCSPIYSNEIIFCGLETHRERVDHLLRRVSLTDIGVATLNAIIISGHKTLIMHEPDTVSSAGKTLAPLTSKLTNGTGANVVIQMNFDAPDTGSHLVTNSHNQLIPFPLDVNFFHELSHARHKTNGTLWLIAAEEQAVADENIYRQEIGTIDGDPIIELRDLTYTDNDKQVWTP